MANTKEKLADVHSELMGLLQRAPYIRCEDVHRQYAVNWLINNGVTVQEWHSADDYPKEDGTYLVQTNTGTITTARFYAFKSFPATKYLPAYHRSPSWQSNRNVVKWTFLPQPPKGE